MSTRTADLFNLAVVRGTIVRYDVIMNKAPSPKPLSTSSLNYDPVTKKFLNWDRRDPWADMEWPAMMRDFLFGKQMRKPSEPLPHLPPDFSKLNQLEDGISFIWLGHSTVFLNFRGRKILVDPVFADSISPVFKNVTPRFQTRPFEISALGPVDYVLISHDHRDHLDRDYVQSLAQSQTQFVVPLGVSRLLQSWGIQAEKIHEMGWWESRSIGGIQWTCTPAQHFSGRGLTDGSKTLWCGWVVESAVQKLFYSGDTGYSNHFQEIGEKWGGFDLALIECGQYNKWWHYLHLLPDEVVKAAQDLRARTFLPVHWGMFCLAFHDWFEPAEQALQIANRNGVSILTPVMGELLQLNEHSENQAWWRSHPDYLQHQANLNSKETNKT